MNRSILAESAQVQFWDSKTDKFPRWTDGEDVISRTGEALAVAAADTEEGTVLVAVASEEPGSMTNLGSYEISTPSKVVNIGNFLAGDYDSFATSGTKVRVTVWAQSKTEHGDPTTIFFQSADLHKK